jgi:hypothetical protein
MGLRPTQGDEKRLLSRPLSLETPSSPLSSRPKRTRISYHAELAASTYAPFRRERRMRIANANKLDRKSGGAQWRDLCVDAPSWKCFSTERSEVERSAVSFAGAHGISLRR